MQEQPAAHPFGAIGVVVGALARVDREEKRIGAAAAMSSARRRTEIVKPPSRSGISLLASTR